MGTPAAAAAAVAVELFPRRLLLRLSGEVYEDEVTNEIGLAGLEWLRARGLFTYCTNPSPLLGRLVEELTALTEQEVLKQLGPRDLASLARGRGARVRGGGGVDRAHEVGQTRQIQPICKLEVGSEDGLQKGRLKRGAGGVEVAAQHRLPVGSVDMCHRR
jgi:hypothetical protein